MSSPLFDEEPSGLLGINSYFRDEIEPGLGAFEERLNAAKPSYWPLFFGLSVLSVIATGLLIYGGEIGAAAVLFVIAEVSIWLYARSKYLLYVDTSKVDEALREHRCFVVGGLASFIGYDYDSDGFPDIARKVQGYGFLPPFTRHSVEDGLSGSIEGLPFQYTVVTSDGRESPFGGHDAVFLIDAPRAFSHYVVVVRGVPSLADGLAGPFANAQHIELEDPRFSEKFSVFSPDQIYARRILTPLMMERLKEFAVRFPAGAVGFVGTEIVVWIQGWDLFETGGMHDDLTDRDVVRRVARGMLLMREITAGLGLVREEALSKEEEWRALL